MLSTKLKEAAGNSADATLYVDDVFSTYLYTGNGSTQTINNGIDLAGKGGLVWQKIRSSSGSHILVDTARGAGYFVNSNTTNAQTYNASVVSSFNADGFTDAGSQASGATYASWTFRKAAKFFDVVTYTGTGSARTIAHSLGVAPGMIIVKRTDTTGNWQVYSNGLTSAAYSIQLNLTNAQASAPTVWNSTAPTSSVFSVGTDATVNASGGTYVAYLYAHDTSSTGIIQCGSYVGNGSTTGPVVTLGWEPQYVMVKNATTSGYNWGLFDSMRGMPVGSNDSILYANDASAEVNNQGACLAPNATGFSLESASSICNSSGDTYIYMAIRRPNKPPTTGTQVFSPVARTGTGATATVTGVGFAPDLITSQTRNNINSGAVWWDRLRGIANVVRSASTGAESTASDSITALTMDGMVVGTDANGYINQNTYTQINWFFKRAPGFFDEVCYTGTGSATTQAHNLGVVPEMIIVKARSAATEGEIYVAPLGNDMALNLFAGGSGAGAAFTTGGIAWNYTTPTSSVFSLGTWNKLNGSGVTFVAYLFATLAGISKVGSYTGNGGTQNIECGFAAGARFVLIKRTDSTGDWYVWDSARGIVSGNDPHLSLNTTAAEVTTDDSVDPYSAGFTVNQVAATNINVTSATYIFLSIS